MNALRILGAGLAGAVLVLAVSLSAASPAEAFCVYNKTNRKITVLQVGGGPEGLDKFTKGFRAALDPGKESCCNWQTKDCNSGGKPTSPVAFAASVEVKDPTRTVWNYMLCAAQTTADGWLEVVGTLSPSDNPSDAWANAVNCKPFTGRPSVVGKGSNQCLDVAGAEDRNGANVVVGNCHNGFNQRWAFTKEGEIRGHGNRCLDVAGGKNANGTNVQMWDCSGGANQKWRVEGEKIVSVFSNKCLDVAAAKTTKEVPTKKTGAQARGANVQIWDCSGRPNQQWTRKGE
jgi:hypothetical protein